MALLGQLQDQIENGFKQRSKKHIQSKFDSHKNGKDVITTASLRDALNDLGIIVKEEEIAGLLKAFDMNDDCGLSNDEFLLLVNSLLSRSSPGMEFIRSLPLAELVFDGLPKEFVCAGEDSLRKLCNMNSRELEDSVKAIAVGLKNLLQESLTELENSYKLLDSKAAANNSSAKKFEIMSMSVGTIHDFHSGITARIGDSQFYAFVCFCMLTCAA
jgi:hypothetical protein